MEIETLIFSYIPIATRECDRPIRSIDDFHNSNNSLRIGNVRGEGGGGGGGGGGQGQ